MHRNVKIMGPLMAERLTLFFCFFCRLLQTTQQEAKVHSIAGRKHGILIEKCQLHPNQNQEEKHSRRPDSIQEQHQKTKAESMVTRVHQVEKKTWYSCHLKEACNYGCNLDILIFNRFSKILTCEEKRKLEKKNLMNLVGRASCHQS